MKGSLPNSRTGHSSRRANTSLPKIDRWLMHGFENYFLPRYLRRHFHALAVNQEHLTAEITAPDNALIVFANHASWWDPMIALLVHRKLLPHHRMVAPIDAEALKRYPIFNRMGFYGIAAHSHRGAADFLQTSLHIAEQPGSSIAITPEGRFCDVRDYDQSLMPGLAHLASVIERREPLSHFSRCVWFLPVAIEYVFWEERLPECLCWFGLPIAAQWGKATADKSQWQVELTSRLRAAQRSLASASIARDKSQFELLLSGQAGTWGLYDTVRRLSAKLRGQNISLEHGDKFSARRHS